MYTTAKPFITVATVLVLGMLTCARPVQAQFTCTWSGGDAGNWFDLTNPLQFQIGINANWDCPGGIEVGGVAVGVVNYPHNPSPLGPFFTAEIPEAALVSVFSFVPIRISNLTLGDPLSIVQLVDASSFGIQNSGGAGIVNGPGQIRLNNAGLFTSDLLIDNTVTLRGGGSLVMGNSLSNRVRGSDAFVGSNTLVVEDFTVRGGGQLGTDSLSIRNLAGGTIRANQTTRLEIDPGNNNNVKNEGLMEAVAGATMRIKQTAVSNAGGTVRAGDGSLVELQEVTLTDGLLTTSGTGAIRSIATVTLESTVATGLQNSGMYEIGNGTGTFIDGQVNNSGTFRLAATAPSPGQFGNTSLILKDDWELVGGGAITMSNFNANRLTSTTGVPNLLTNMDHVIAGSGILLNLRVDNRATIRAFQTEPLVLQPADGLGNFKNTGLIEAINGSTMVFRISDFENMGGRILADDANLLVEASGTIFGGDVDLVLLSELRLDNGSVVGAETTNSTQGVIRTIGGKGNRLSGTVDNPAGGRIVISDETRLTFDAAGTYKNAGKIEMAGQGPFFGFGSTILFIDGRVKLEGGGEVVMTNALDNAIMSVFGVGSVLTNEDNFIHGGGQIGRNVLGIVNRATIEADQPFVNAEQPGVLEIDPGGLDEIDDFVNEGILQATGGGTLQLLNGEYNNTAGVIQAADGSRINLEQAVTITGGPIRTTGSGQVHVNRDVTFDGIGMQLDGKFVVNELGRLRLIGNFTNAQEISLNGGQLRIDGEVILEGGGVIDMAASANNKIIGFPGSVPGDKLINETNVIQGIGAIGVNALSIVNKGSIDANQPGVLEIDPGGPGELLVNAGGTLQATGGGTLRLRPGTYVNDPGGVIQALDGSVVELNNVLTIEGGVIAGLGGVVRATGGGLTGTTLDGVGLTILGRYEIAQFATTTLKGDITNAGQIVLGSPDAPNPLPSVLQWIDEVFLDGGGEIVLSDTNLHLIRSLSGNAPLVNEDNTIHGAGNISGNITNNGTVRADGGTLVIDPLDSRQFLNQGRLETTASGDIEMLGGPFSTSGEVTVAGGSIFHRTGDYVQTAGSTVVNGTLIITAGSINIEGGTFGGAGQVVGDVNTSGTTSPGTSPGTFSVDGNFMANPGSELVIEIGPDDFDMLMVTGDATVGGTLRVLLLPGAVFPAGAEFDFLTAGNVLGGFDVVEIPTNPDGAPLLSLSQDGGTLTLTALTAVPEPGSIALLVIGLMLGLATCRRRAR